MTQFGKLTNLTIEHIFFLAEREKKMHDGGLTGKQRDPRGTKPRLLWLHHVPPTRRVIRLCKHR